MRATVGTVQELRERGCITAKLGNRPVCVFWHDDQAWAVDDRCPHMGFPLHRGTVENGLLTCHWHNARFDLASGGTLDPFADDVRAYEVEVEGDDVVVVAGEERGSVEHDFGRLADGLEQGLTLVIAKAVLALLEAGVRPSDIVRSGLDFATTYRGAGWGAGATVLVAMANVLPHLDPADRPLALVHGLVHVSRDTRGRPPRFPLDPLGSDRPEADRLRSWYRRFVDTRAADAAERALATAIAAGLPAADVARIMTAAATDHVFLDVGHTIDFTNKAFEALDHLGPEAAASVLPSLVAQTAAAHRHEEDGAWQHPHDLAGMVAAAVAALPERLARAAAQGRTFPGDKGVAALAWQILEDDPAAVVASVDAAVDSGATPEELGRAVAYAAALRITRFHTQNDHGDWDVIHHGFTTANAVHQLLVRAPSPELLRAVYHGALWVYLDRFLNVPAARVRPTGETPSLEALASCWEEQGRVDEAGAIAYGWITGGGDPAALIAALGHALLAEDAGFHWFQAFEAAVRQAEAWGPATEEAAMVLAGTARFLAAHTPTRRELPQVVRIATRLRRGEALFEDDGG